MTNASDIAEKYLSALYGGDLQTARQLLADNLSFSGPAASFSSADEFLKATQHVVRAVKGLQKRKVFADGPDVCIFYDLVIDHPVASIAIADWYHIDGKGSHRFGRSPTPVHLSRPLAKRPLIQCVA